MASHSLGYFLTLQPNTKIPITNGKKPVYSAGVLGYKVFQCEYMHYWYGKNWYEQIQNEVNNITEKVLLI